MKATLFTDGGARGNPGPAAYAYVLEAADGTVLDARGETIGIATNNVAEYRALVAGLSRAAAAGVSELEVVSDSELLVKQMRGEYRVKNRAFRAMRDLNSGITYINAGTIGAEVHLPFGGTKETGNGHREAGQAALDVFTEWKSVYVDYSATLQRAQIDNVE